MQSDRKSLTGDKIELGNVYVLDRETLTVYNANGPFKKLAYLSKPFEIVDDEILKETFKGKGVDLVPLGSAQGYLEELITGRINKADLEALGISATKTVKCDKNVTVEEIITDKKHNDADFKTRVITPDGKEVDVC